MNDLSSKEHLPRSILVVDDQEAWRVLLAELLEDEFNVATAASYNQAVALIEDPSQNFTVVVTDIRMVDADNTNIDGLRLARLLRDRGGQIQVVVVTAYSTDQTFQLARNNLAVYDCIDKVNSSGAFDHKHFRRVVRAAAQKTGDVGAAVLQSNAVLPSHPTHFLTWRIIPPAGEPGPVVNRVFTLVLNLTEEPPSSTAYPISLARSARWVASSPLQVILRAEKMRLVSNALETWQVSHHGRTAPFEAGLIPQKTGRLALDVFLRQDSRELQRFTIDVETTA